MTAIFKSDVKTRSAGPDGCLKMAQTRLWALEKCINWKNLITRVWRAELPTSPSPHTSWKLNIFTKVASDLVTLHSIVLWTSLLSDQCDRIVSKIRSKIWRETVQTSFFLPFPRFTNVTLFQGFFPPPKQCDRIVVHQINRLDLKKTSPNPATLSSPRKKNFTFRKNIELEQSLTIIMQGGVRRRANSLTSISRQTSRTFFNSDLLKHGWEGSARGQDSIL